MHDVHIHTVNDGEVTVNRRICGNLFLAERIGKRLVMAAIDGPLVPFLHASKACNSLGSDFRDNLQTDRPICLSK